MVVPLNGENIMAKMWVQHNGNNVSNITATNINAYFCRQWDKTAVTIMFLPLRGPMQQSQIFQSIPKQIFIKNYNFSRLIYFLFLDGVVLVDPEYLKDRRVFGHVLAAFRYGREDLDVLGELIQLKPDLIRPKNQN